MPPTLHQRITKAQAVAAFIPATDVRDFCDGQFYIGGDSILCFLTIPMPAESVLKSPSNIEWNSPTINYHLDEELPWLPKAVRNTDYSPPIRVEDARNWWGTVYSGQATKGQTRQHELFLRSQGQVDFFYVGPAHLGSYSMSL